MQSAFGVTVICHYDRGRRGNAVFVDPGPFRWAVAAHCEQKQNLLQLAKQLAEQDKYPWHERVETYMFDHSGPTIAMQPAAAFGVAPTCAEPCEPSADTKVIELDDIPDTQIDPDRIFLSLLQPRWEQASPDCLSSVNTSWASLLNMPSSTTIFAFAAFGQ